ncbi:hypothetical protein [Bordetella petrii]|uniref:hypothetical protein n=1 Tax=Bordetella petrii TaxID=94624 RepID=UPI001E654FBC|nr:hypothetical protein [Bordetella petrii]MCD0501874.1 hypothetical protein [Bordetella petrii]
MSDSMAEWRQGDDYYWAGAPGWTICRVWLDGAYRYELWHTRQGVACLVGSRASMQGTIALYEQEQGRLR